MPGPQMRKTHVVRTCDPLACFLRKATGKDPRVSANCLQRASPDHMRHRGAQLHPTSQAATSTGISVAIRGGRITKRSCLRSVGWQQRSPAGWASQPAGGPHNSRHIAGLPFRCQEAHVRIHPGVSFNSRSTARRWQDTEPVFPQNKFALQLVRIHAC
eukprot:362997-Chlamydomonas_euryale.AAC.7